jgi:hypothetical protein
MPTICVETQSKRGRSYRMAFHTHEILYGAVVRVPTRFHTSFGIFSSLGYWYNMLLVVSCNLGHNLPPSKLGNDGTKTKKYVCAFQVSHNKDNKAFEILSKSLVYKQASHH